MTIQIFVILIIYYLEIAKISIGHSPGLPGSDLTSCPSRSASAAWTPPSSGICLCRRVMPRSGGVGGVVLVRGGGPTGGPDPVLVVYNKPSSLASFSSCACCLLSATCAAITLCRSAMSVHLAQTQSRHLQYLLWPWKSRKMRKFLFLLSDAKNVKYFVLLSAQRQPRGSCTWRTSESSGTSQKPSRRKQVGSLQGPSAVT